MPAKHMHSWSAQETLRWNRSSWQSTCWSARIPPPNERSARSRHAFKPARMPHPFISPLSRPPSRDAVLGTRIGLLRALLTIFPTDLVQFQARAGELYEVVGELDESRRTRGRAQALALARKGTGFLGKGREFAAEGRLGDAMGDLWMAEAMLEKAIAGETSYWIGPS